VHTLLLIRVCDALLQSLCGSLGPREELLGELQSAAAPLTSAASPQVRLRVEDSVAAAVSAWQATSGKVRSLCSQYQEAVTLWQRYLVAADALRVWTDSRLRDTTDHSDFEQLHNLAALAKVRTPSLCFYHRGRIVLFSTFNVCDFGRKQF